MESAFSFKIIDLPIEFERFFMQYYLLWESDWIRQQKYVGTDYYAIEGNLATWKNYYSTENFILLECFMNNEAIGYLSYKTENERIHMEALLLLPNFRGKGLMAKMLGAFFNFLETENISWNSIYLETNAHNPANSIYRKFGFTVAEVREKDRENGEDTIVYELQKKQNVPRIIFLHRTALITSVILMINPFFVMILTAVYGFLILLYWLHKLPIRNKIWWTLVPISIPWLFWGILALLANFSKLL